MRLVLVDRVDDNWTCSYGERKILERIKSDGLYPNVRNIMRDPSSRPIVDALFRG